MALAGCSTICRDAELTALMGDSSVHGDALTTLTAAAAAAMATLGGVRDLARGAAAMLPLLAARGVGLLLLAAAAALAFFLDLAALLRQV